MNRSQLDAMLAALPEEAIVLDVGGWAEPHPRADWVIDIGAYETRNYYAERLGHERGSTVERFTHETWVQHDICAPEPWPLADGAFDFAICMQTLEDVRDPVKVCAEMSRVAAAGYVETPAAAIELTRGIESAHWCGWHHHRWLVEVEGGALVFIGKPHHIHSRHWPSIRSPKLLRPDAAGNVELGWHGTLEAREEVFVDNEALDARLASIVARSSRPDPLGRARRQALAAASDRYVRLRTSLGRLARAAR